MRKTYVKSSKMYKNTNGYLCFKGSQKPLHRWMAEKKLGRPLKAGEVVHHKDRNKLNNSPQNLWVFKNQEAHDTAHKIDAMNHGAKYSFKGK